MSSLQTDFRNKTLSSAHLEQVSRQIMAANLAHGKGVVSGLDLAPEDQGVSVSPGEFAALIHDTVAETFTVPLDLGFSGYLWLKTGVQAGSHPDYETTMTSDDFDSIWVCLGKVWRNDSVCGADMGDGRMVYGHRDFKRFDEAVERVAASRIATQNAKP